MGVVSFLKRVLKSWQLCLSFKIDVHRHPQPYNIVSKSIIINKVDYNNSYMYVCSVDIYLLCMIKVRVRWCTFSLCENVITLGRLIGLLILFCHPLLSILFLKLQK